MASVILFDAIRMQAIEDGTVTSGLVDGSGNLILTHHDGSTVNAGHVVGNPALATPLASDADAIAGTSTTEAVTPHGLAAARPFASDADAIAGTSTTEIVNPHGLASALVTEITPVISLTGVVSSSWSSGLAPVVLDAGQLVSGTRNCYIGRGLNVMPGDKVIVEQVGGTYFITSAALVRPEFMRQIPLTLNFTNFTNYSDSVNDPSALFADPMWHNASGLTAATPIYCTMTQTGIVQLLGLVFGSGAVAGTVIAQLPSNMWPSRTQVFEVQSSGGYATVYVTPDGNLRYLSGSLTSIDLSTVTFRAASAVASGAATWVPFGAMLNSYVPYTTSFGTGDPGGAGSHTPGYTIDAEGVVIFEGAISGGGSTVDVYVCTALATQVTDIFGIAAGGSTGNAYMRFGGNTAASQVGVGNTLTMSIAGSWNSLANIIVWPTGTWLTPAKFSSWAKYNVGYNDQQIIKTLDGQVFMRGVISGGTLASSLSMIASKGWRPRYEMEPASVANAAFAYVNVGVTTASSNIGRTGNAQVGPAGGSNIWFCLANIHWAAYM